jgi:uncharacterized protein YecT (DUF1311 family)
MKTILSLFVSLALIGFAAAQTESSKPAPEMEKLIKMWAGRWTTVEQFEPSDEMPHGKRDKGAETMRPGPGSLSLIGDYESHGAPFGHMIVTWIPQERVYKSYWLDLTQPAVSVSTGRWQGDKLVFTSVVESTGKKLEVRDTYSDITPLSFTDTLETGPVGGPMKKVLTVKYTKQDNTALQTNPCDASLTQADMNECFGQESRRADAHLNVIYKKLLSSMEKGFATSSKRNDIASLPQEEESTKKLKAAELAWINYRDLHCDAAQYEYEGGSMRPMVWATCMETVTKHRIEEIKTAYENGDMQLE